MVRSTLQWIAALLILAGLGGGSYAYWLYSHTDEELSALVLEAVKKKLPNAELTITRARFDWSHKVHLYDVRLSAKGLSEPLARFAEIVITLDIEELAAGRHIEVRSIHIVRPDLRVMRDEEGHWNWQKVLPINETADFIPEIALEQLQMIVRVDRHGQNPLTFHVQQRDMRLVPSARHAFTVQGDAQLPGVGSFSFDGGCDVDNGTWSAGGSTTGALKIADLLETFARVFPDTAQRAAALQKVITDSSFPTDSPGANRAGTSGNSSWAQSAAGMAVDGQAEIRFKIARQTATDKLTYWVAAKLEQGEIDHRILPFPLHGITGKVYADNRQLILQEIQARNGPTLLSIDGKFDLPQPAAKNRLDIKIQDLLLDRRLQSRLPIGLRRFYESVRPGGPVDAAGAIVLAQGGQWQPAGWAITHKRCSVWHEKFPYAVTDIVGTTIQRGNSLVLDLQGRAGDRPIRLRGSIINPGPDAEAFYRVEIARVPINDTLLSAAAAQPALHRTLTALRLRGLLDVECQFHRLPDPDRKIEWDLAARLDEGSIEYEHFPYRIADLRGSVAFDSNSGRWTFRDLRGDHGPAKLTGAGTFVKTSPANPGELRLEVHAEEAPLENDLAMAFPPETRRLWELIGPGGKLRTHVLVNWTPGSKPEITVPEGTVTDGTLEIKSFPYPLDHVTTRFAMARDPELDCDRISILTFEGHHDETSVRIDHSGKSFILCPPAGDPVGEWRLHLDRLNVDDLVPDRALRNALPPGLRKTIQALNPQGKVSLDGMIELRGTRRPEDSVTAAWNFQTVLSGATIVTGVDLKNVHGLVQSRGLWDGTNVLMEGSVDLRSVYVWNHQFGRVRGPFKLDNQELTVGSAEVFRPLAAGEREPPIGPEQRLTAHAVGGTCFLDAQAHLDADKTSYRVKAAMQDASLEQYARLYLRGPTSLRGVMSGWVELAGTSSDPKDATGRGLLLIYPAALYELPVFVQIFKLFSLAPVDKTAFNYALTRFYVNKRQVDFHAIDLIGDALSLRGRGTATFDGALRLDFFSRSARGWQIPFLEQMTQGWVGVKVTGTVQNPRADIRAAPPIDTALQQFLSAFNPRPGTVPPLTPPPWMPTFPMMPITAPRSQSASATP